MEFSGLDQLQDMIVAQLNLVGPATIEQLSRQVGSPEYKVLVALRKLAEERFVEALPGGMWMAVGEYKKKSLNQ